MAGFDAAPRSKSGAFKGAVAVLLAALFALSLPLTAEAHGRKAVPSDPALLAQYRAGLSAYLNKDYATALDAWRLLASFEAANGIIMFGWTTALLFAVVHRVATHEALLAKRED